MNKKRTPASTVVFYIIGIILLIVSLFMLWTAVSYTKAYLQSYDASFKDMWSNSVQYIITQFLPYFGMGIICLGLGRAISGSANAKAVYPEKEEEDDSLAADLQKVAKANAAKDRDAKIAAQIEELSRGIEANREVLSIKIEEKEKRDSYRIKELEKKVDGFLEDIIYINQPLEDLVYKQAAGIEEEPAAEAAYAEEEAAETVEAAAEAAAPGTVPQFFRVAKTMTMPACPAVTAAAGAVPPVFRVARTMTMTV